MKETGNGRIAAPVSDNFPEWKKFFFYTRSVLTLRIGNRPEKRRIISFRWWHAFCLLFHQRHNF
jgi:hypothetical protein